MQPGSGGPPQIIVSAYYLPQFHPTVENDEWWGQGFTEWTNVARARPLYPGHRQPQLPGALGFYDLRTPEVRLQQADMARTAGVTAFGYWHYWFDGRLILQRPSEEVLSSGQPDFPFYFAWANESWTGHWHGLEKSMLLEQTYPGAQDDRRHFDYLAPFFHDPRHLRIDGRPVFSLYKPAQIPKLEAMLERWNTMAVESGLSGIYWVGQADGADDLTQLTTLLDRVHLNPQTYWAPLFSVPGRILHWARLPRLIDATKTAALIADSLRRTPDLAACVLPNWDNTPRSQRRGWVMVRDQIQSFVDQLDVAYAHEVERSTRTGHEGLIVIKSWNEWAEGNCLEPGGTWGNGYLDAVRSAARRWTPLQGHPPVTTGDSPVH